MTKKIAFILALGLAPTLVAAECDFPYYPEFADRICQYDEVTPLMATKATMSNHSIGQKPGDIVCEPLLVKTIVGMPAYYMVATYGGDDLGAVRKWNAIIREINGGSKLPANRLGEKLKPFLDDELFRQFTWVAIPTYKFLSTFKAASGGVPSVLWGYEEAYEKAKEVYGSDDFDFVRIIALGHAHVQAFEFVNASGETVAIEVDKYERASVADLEKIEADMDNWVRSWYELFDADSDLIERNARGWREIELEVPDEAAQKEFPKITEPLNTGSSGVHDDGPIYISDCPDPKQEIVDRCWAWAVSAVFVYHSQHTPNKGNPTLGFTFWEKTIPVFDDNPWQTSPTQEYVSELQGEYYDLYEEMWPEYPPEQGTAFKFMTLTANQFVQDQGYPEKPSLWNMWRFEVWTHWTSDEPPKGVYKHNFGVPWSVATLIKGQKKPMASAYEHFYGEDRRHACPLIGHMEGTPRKGVYYDMNGEFYVPYTELLWWQDDEHSDLTDRHHGIQMTVPSGPDYDPWVTTFLVDRDKPETTINWAVSTNVDVKGFKVYHVPSSGERSQVGPELVRVKSVDDLAYTCADSQDRPAGCYVLELVRNTPDKTRYLYPEGITR